MMFTSCAPINNSVRIQRLRALFIYWLARTLDMSENCAHASTGQQCYRKTQQIQLFHIINNKMNNQVN